MPKLVAAALCLASVIPPVFADAVAPVNSTPTRLADGRPFTCVYYFPHWWEPWKSSDDAIRADLKALQAMGISVLACDHEWSQAIDGNWKWLDRGHRLAREAGLQILPWLSLKVWSDMTDGDRPAIVKQWYGVSLKRSEKQDGSPAGLRIWDEATIAAGAAYASQYVDRYRDQALLKLRWQGRDRPVVALSVELAWDGGFDDETNRLFVSWLQKRYAGDVGRLNRLWQTGFATFGAITPRDRTVFDYEHLQAGAAAHRRAVEDHIEFRSQMISDSLGRMAARLRQKHPDVLILAELPYQLASEHPHAEGYRIGYAANPSCARSADILFLRCTGLLSAREADFLANWRKRTGQPVILTYRTYSDWSAERPDAETARLADLYANQAAAAGNGFGFYSWNEMVDTHVAPSRAEDLGKPGALTAAQSARSVALMSAMVKRYLELVKLP